MSRRVSSPVTNCKVAFFRAVLRCQTAGSACSKWCPSAQKHFRVRKNVGRAYHGTFKPPLYRRDCVLWRHHKRIRPRGLCTHQRKHACLDAVLLLRTFLFHLRPCTLSLKSALWYLLVTQHEDCQTHIWLSDPLDTHSGGCVYLQMDKTWSV